MVKLKNMGTVAFREYVKNRKIYIFGAGRALEACLDLYFENKDIQLIIDNDKRKWGTKVEHNNKEVPVGGVPELISYVKRESDKNKVTVLITSPIYATEIVEQLDEIDDLSGVECFLQVIIRNTKETFGDFCFSSGKPMIPKIIHYIWMGSNQLPEEYKKNIEKCRTLNPNYEIKIWNENNYDFKKNAYMKEAYELGCYGFVVNYARLDIVHNEGGIYLDTDVEVINKLDNLLNDAVFFNMGCSDRINMGCGFGANKGNSIIKEIMLAFENSHFADDNGKALKKPCNSFVNPILKRIGFEMINKYQKIGDAVLYPSEVMSPLSLEFMEDNFTEKTLSVHNEHGTWRSGQEIVVNDKLQDLYITRMEQVKR